MTENLKIEFPVLGSQFSVLRKNTEAEGFLTEN
jgi:hypothetical protein